MKSLDPVQKRIRSLKLSRTQCALNLLLILPAVSSCASQIDLRDRLVAGEKDAEGKAKEPRVESFKIGGIGH